MTLAISILSAVIAVMLLVLWLGHRESEKIARSFVDNLLERLRAVDQERIDWKEERRELQTRLQGWEPVRPEPKPTTPPKPEPSPVTSLSDDLGDTGESAYTEAQLLAFGLQKNSDGGYVDEFGYLYEEPKDFVAYRKWLVKFGMPEDTNPREHPEWSR